MSGIDHLLDTNMVIGLLKGDPAAVEMAQRVNLLLNRTGISQITRMELLGFPGLTATEEAATRAFLADCRVLPITDAAEQKAIELRRSGALKLPDAVIAATAITAGAKLLTLDQRLARVVDALG